jgi:hypothetical protein
MAASKPAMIPVPFGHSAATPHCYAETNVMLRVHASKREGMLFVNSSSSILKRAAVTAPIPNRALP